MFQPERPVPGGTVTAVLRHPQAGVLTQFFRQKIDSPLLLQRPDQAVRPGEFTPPTRHGPALGAKRFQSFFPGGLVGKERGEIPCILGPEIGPGGDLLHRLGGMRWSHHILTLLEPGTAHHLLLRLPSARLSLR